MSACAAGIATGASRHDEFVLGVSDSEYPTRDFAQYFFQYAAEQHEQNPRSSVRPNNQQMSSILFGKTHDVDKRMSDSHVAIYRNSDHWFVFPQIQRL